MELDPPEVARGVGERGERRGVGRSKRHKSRRRINDRVAVAHPDALTPSAACATEPVKEWTLRGTNADVGGTILTPIRRANAPTKLLRHQLHAVADAKNRNAGAPEGGVWLWPRVVIDGEGAAAQDDAGRLARQDLTHRKVKWHERRIHVHLANATCDQLCKLAAEI